MKMCTKMTFVGQGFQTLESKQNTQTQTDRRNQ